MPQAATPRCLAPRIGTGGHPISKMYTVNIILTSPVRDAASPTSQVTKPAGFAD